MKQMKSNQHNKKEEGIAIKEISVNRAQIFISVFVSI
jgi:hypothetical protein